MWNCPNLKNTYQLEVTLCYTEDFLHVFVDDLHHFALVCEACGRHAPSLTTPAVPSVSTLLKSNINGYSVFHWHGTDCFRYNESTTKGQAIKCFQYGAATLKKSIVMSSWSDYPLLHSFDWNHMQYGHGKYLLHVWRELLCLLTKRQYIHINSMLLQ